MIKIQYRATRETILPEKRNAACRDAAVFFRRWLPLLFIFGLFLLLLKNPAVTASAALDGLLLSGRTVLPSTFPYMILSSFLLLSGGAKTVGKLFGGIFQRCFYLPPEGAAVVLMGMISGFPVGASCAAELYLAGGCTKEEAERMLCFCNFCGPPFLLGAVAGFLGSPSAGLLLCLTQTAGMLLLGVFLGRRARRRSGALSERERIPAAGLAGKTVERRSLFLLFYEAVKNACRSMLQITGCIVFFSIISGLLGDLSGGEHGGFLLFLRCFLEISGGARAAAGVKESLGMGAAVFLSGLNTVWSGMSVHMQVASFALPAGLSMKKYFGYRIPAALIIAALATAFCCAAGVF